MYRIRYFTLCLSTTNIVVVDRKTLDCGGKGRKGGGNEAYRKWFWHTPYFLVIADDQEG